MAASEEITITLQLDDQGAVSGIRSVNDEVEHLGTEGASQAQSFGDTMSVALGNLAADAAMQLADQMGQLISQGQKLVQRGAEIEEMQSKFNTVFGESSNKVQQFIQDQAQMMGLTETRAQELLSTAGSIAQGAGAAKDESAEMSVQVGQLAGDLASFNNAKPQQAFEAITSALTGEREQLKQFGIVIKESMVQQRALSMTSKENADALTQQEKALASLKLMYEKAGPAVGDLERTSESAANTGRRAGAAWGDVRDEFAERLLPVASDLNEELLALAESEEVMATVRTSAKALAEQLTTAIELGSGFVQVFAENSDEIKTGAEVIGLLTAGVTSYVAATKLQVLWTKRAVIAQKAATIAQRGLNAALKANPIGLVVSALGVALPLLYRFRDSITDAAASMLDFAAKTTRGLQNVVDHFRGLLDSLPSGFPGLEKMKALVEGAGAAVDENADRMEGWADSLREFGEETEETTSLTKDQTDQMEFNTDAVGENTDALDENREAREGAADAPPLPAPEVTEPEDQTIDVEEPDLDAHLFDAATEAGQVLDQTLLELAGSSDQFDHALEAVNEELKKTSDPEKRAQLQSLRTELQRAQKAANIVDRGLSNMGRSAKQAAVDGFVALGQAIGDTQKSMADFGQAARQILSDLAGMIGKQLITMGTSLVFVPGFQAQGAAYIAAGTALTALSASIAPSSGGSGDGTGSDRRDEPRRANVPSMRSGGRVEEGQPVLVGDGPGGRVTPYSELFVPDTSGTVVPRSKMNVSQGAQPRGGADRVEQKLDEVARRIEEKTFRLRGKDLITSQRRQESIYNDASM